MTETRSRLSSPRRHPSRCLSPNHLLPIQAHCLPPIMPPPTRSVSHPSALDLSSTAPRIQATPALRAFRHEAQMSWSSFNRLWMDISQILNSPSFDILLDCRSALTHNYVVRLADLTRHVLASGAFGPTTVGRWHQGRHEEEADRDQYVHLPVESVK